MHRSDGFNRNCSMWQQQPPTELNTTADVRIYDTLVYQRCNSKKRVVHISAKYQSFSIQLPQVRLGYKCASETN